jgi:hypothetical protein
MLDLLETTGADQLAAAIDEAMEIGLPDPEGGMVDFDADD